MSAACLGCAVGAGKIAAPKFKLGDPVGCCLTCHALMCGKHGERDPGPPSFECVLCAPGLLAASAVSAATTGQPTVQGPLADLSSFGHGAGSRGRVFYPTVQAFVDRHPEYGEDLRSALLTAHWRPAPPGPDDNPLRNAVRRLPPAALALLGAAKLLAERLELPPEQLSRALREGFEAVMRDGGSATRRSR